MRIDQARTVARQWVACHAGEIAGFSGAYFSGSTLEKPDDWELPVSSDVDVMVVVEGGEPPMKLGKLREAGVLLEVSFVSRAQLSSVEAVLDHYHLANGLKRDGVISDPMGWLRPLQRAVAARFPLRAEVERRVRGVIAKVDAGLAAVEAGPPTLETFNGWLFSTGICCHALLVAGLQNPTVRLRYRAARQLLETCGLSAAYSELTGLLGVNDFSRDRAAQCLEALAVSFDLAASCKRTPFFFSSDLSPEARPIVVEGSRELIEAGEQREAAFWMAATLVRCQQVFRADAPELWERRAPALRDMADAMGVGSMERLRARAAQGRAYLPRLQALCGQVMASTPGVV